MIPLRSPETGEPLRADTPHSLTGGGRRWPVVDGIAYLRTGREDLAAASLARLDEGDHEAALVLLLADSDDWWDGAPPEPEALHGLVRERDRLTLRDAMARLAYGRVADYFAHRWSDPTFVAGLALIEAHAGCLLAAAPAGPSRSAFELACGIGHYLRELAGRGFAVIGADVVFSKLWLARHWVVGEGADLVCFDAGGMWPIGDLRADLVLCQDAFYFLEPKAAVLSALRQVAGPDGILAVGHVHNRAAGNLSAGAGVTADEIEALFPDGLVYDDDELTRAAVAVRAPVPQPPAELAAVEAFSIAAGPGRPARPEAVEGRLTLPDAESAGWRLNPLYQADPAGEHRVAWPSERYRREYEPRATYPARSRGTVAPTSGEPVPADRLRRRELVVLPDRW